MKKVVIRYKRKEAIIMEIPKNLEDLNIIDLLFQRSEQALAQMSVKYEKLIYRVCHLRK